MWTKVLPQYFGSISVAATSLGSSVALAKALQATHQLRHAAVHRLPTSVKGIERMLQCGLDLATALKDQECMIKLNNILKDFQATMQDMELHKNNLESQLDEELRDIQDQREVLDKREKEAKLNMLQQDRENTTTISSLFEQSIRKLKSTDEDGGNSAEQNDSRDVDPEVSESDAVAVAGDKTNDSSAEHDETAADDAFSDDAYSKESTRIDTEPIRADPLGNAEQPSDFESAALPSELDQWL